MFEVSVIIPVYNAENFIEQAINSALEQDEVKEIILIEDGSSDRSLEICAQLHQKNDRVKLFRHENGQNKGAGASRNLGILKAQYMFIAFLDADDYYLANRFKKCQEVFKNNQNCDGVYNCMKLVHEVENDDTADFTTMDAVKIAPKELFYKMAPIGDKGFFAANALTVKKSVFTKVGLFNTSLKLSQDTQMWIRMSLLVNLFPGELINPVAVARNHEDRRSTDLDRIAYYRPFVFKSLLNWAKEHNIYSWTPQENLSCINCYDPLITTSENTIFQVSIQDSLGCFVINKSIELRFYDNSTLSVPTAFTPNEDGNNDIIYVNGYGLKELIEFKIYNRWGEVVYDNPGDLEQGWDGIYKGKIQPVESYIVIARALDFNDEELKYKGSINILK